VDFLINSNRLVESHSGARGDILAGPSNIFTGPLWKKKFEFFFSSGTFWRTLYFWPKVGPPNVAPLPHPLEGPER